MKFIIFLVILFLTLDKSLAQDTVLQRQASDFCSNVDSAGARFMLFGYTIEEAKGTFIREFKDGVMIDSSSVDLLSFSRRNKSKIDSLALRFRIGFKGRFLHTNNTYQICIPGYPPKILSNMIIRAVFTGRESYMCDLTEYDIDGVTHRDWLIEIYKKSPDKLE